MVFCDDLQVQNNHRTYVPFKNFATFWENTAENDVTLPRGGGHMYPLLRLYRGCHVMLPCNRNVQQGQANGTQATFKKLILKPGEVAQQVLLDGTIPVVAAVRASQVSHVLLHHTNNRIPPATFSLQPRQQTFKAQILKPRALQVKDNDCEVLQMEQLNFLYSSTMKPQATSYKAQVSTACLFTAGAMSQTGFT
jgi:hypothetical protein